MFEYLDFIAEAESMFAESQSIEKFYKQRRSLQQALHLCD